MLRKEGGGGSSHGAESTERWGKRVVCVQWWGFARCEQGQQHIAREVATCTATCVGGPSVLVDALHRCPRFYLLLAGYCCGLANCRIGHPPKLLHPGVVSRVLHLLREALLVCHFSLYNAESQSLEYT